MADDNNTDILGKKIFFIHPSVYVQNEIVAELVQQEHEVYVVKDETKLQKVLRNYPDSIVFASIDETLAAKKWETWIRSIMADSAITNVKIGVLSNTNDTESRRLYLNTIKVPCGFIPVKTGTAKVIQAILEILKSVEAKGRRKFIRADTKNETMTTVNIAHMGSFITGVIQDISVVGLSCIFANDPEMEKNSLFPDIQIKLQSTLLKAEGIVFGSRLEGEAKIYVIVFTPKIDPSVKAKIRAYIQKNLQAKMDVELK
jgi:hypothetical protein